MRYEDGLAGLVIRKGAVGPEPIALAHIAGFSDRVRGWFADARSAGHDVDEEKAFRIFDAMLGGSATEIEALLLNLDIPLGGVSDVLVFLDRRDLFVALYERLVERSRDSRQLATLFEAVDTLSKAGDWPRATALLRHAKRTIPDLEVDPINSRNLLSRAYRDHELATFVPLLEQFRRADELRWAQISYQICAGAKGLNIPIIPDKQPIGYMNAVAVQIAALEDDPAAASVVSGLHRLVRPHTVEVTAPERGFRVSLTDFPAALVVARARIAAARKDYDKAKALARSPSDGMLIGPSVLVVDALLQTGDWRGAAMIASEHDERRLPVHAGLDDDRLERYVELQRVLAALAARDGDDSAASSFLSNAMVADDPEPDRLHVVEFAKLMGLSEEERRKQEAEVTQDRFLLLETALAGAAEGLLPRQLIELIVPTHRFRSFD